MTPAEGRDAGGGPAPARRPGGRSRSEGLRIRAAGHIVCVTHGRDVHMRISRMLAPALRAIGRCAWDGGRREEGRSASHEGHRSQACTRDRHRPGRHRHRLPLGRPREDHRRGPRHLVRRGVPEVRHGWHARLAVRHRRGRRGHDLQPDPRLLGRPRGQRGRDDRHQLPGPARPGRHRDRAHPRPLHPLRGADGHADDAVLLRGRLGLRLRRRQPAPHVRGRHARPRHRRCRQLLRRRRRPRPERRRRCSEAGSCPANRTRPGRAPDAPGPRGRDPDRRTHPAAPAAPPARTRRGRFASGRRPGALGARGRRPGRWPTWTFEHPVGLVRRRILALPWPDDPIRPHARPRARPPRTRSRASRRPSRRGSATRSLLPRGPRSRAGRRSPAAATSSSTPRRGAARRLPRSCGASTASSARRLRPRRPPAAHPSGSSTSAR